jgi:hypothetical protein
MSVEPVTLSTLLATPSRRLIGCQNANAKNYESLGNGTALADP